MRNAFIRALFEKAKEDPRIFLITADLGYSVLEEFAAAFPERFLNVGVAEQNAVGVAAGLAMSGWKPYVYSIVPFATMRCFEQIRVDVAYARNNVKLVGVGAGLSYGPAGATHHAIEDLAIMRALPGMTILCPGDPHETHELTRQSVDHPGPGYLRLGKGGEPPVHQLPVVLGEPLEVRSGKSLNLLCTSNLLETGIQAAERLRVKRGLELAVWSIHTLKPFPEALIRKLAASGTPIATLEEHSRIGGLGSAVAECLSEGGYPALTFRRFGLPDEYTHVVGSQNYLRRHYGLDPDALAVSLAELVP